MFGLYAVPSITIGSPDRSASSHQMFREPAGVLFASLDYNIERVVGSPTSFASHDRASRPRVATAAVAHPRVHLPRRDESIGREFQRAEHVVDIREDLVGQFSEAVGEHRACSRATRCRPPSSALPM